MKKKHFLKGFRYNFLWLSELNNSIKDAKFESEKNAKIFDKTKFLTIEKNYCS